MNRIDRFGHGVAAAGIALWLAFAGATDASAAFAWKFGSKVSGQASASLYSSNALSAGTRAIDFHPLLTLSCDVARPGVWRQSVRIREPISGEASVDVQVRVDQGPQQTQSWAIGQKNRALMLDGAAGMARLGRASRLRIAWASGFFGDDGEAVFDMKGAGQVIAALAASCGVDPPTR